MSAVLMIGSKILTSACITAVMVLPFSARASPAPSQDNETASAAAVSVVPSGFMRRETTSSISSSPKILLAARLQSFLAALTIAIWTGRAGAPTISIELRAASFRRGGRVVRLSGAAPHLDAARDGGRRAFRLLAALH